MSHGEPNTITSEKKFFVFVNQDQDIVHIPNIMVDAPAQKFTGKNLSWRIIELELGENLVVYKKTSQQKTHCRGYFYITHKQKKKIHVLHLQH